MRYDHDIRQGGATLRGARRNPAFVAAGIATTLVLHGGLVGFVVYQALAEPEPDEKSEQKMEFEDVELLKLGEDKPDQQLPRIANPPAPTPEQETVTLEDEEEEPEEKQKRKPEKTQEKTESPPDPEARNDESERREEKMAEAFKNLENPNRPTNDEVPEGSEKGVAGGTVSDEAMANLMKTYQARLLQKIGEYWQVPQTIPDRELEALFGKATVYVRLSDEGHIVSYDFRRRTSNGQFNRSIERVLRQFQASGGGHSLPLPEKPDVRRAVLEQGLQLRQWRFTQK